MRDDYYDYTDKIWYQFRMYIEENINIYIYIKTYTVSMYYVYYI